MANIVLKFQPAWLQVGNREGGDNMAHATVGQIAQMVGLHPNTIRNWTDEGIIECMKDFRGRRRFPHPLKTVREIQGLLNGECKPKKGSE